MGPVLEELVPDVAALRATYFTHLAELIAREPAVHELNRIATAEETGCFLDDCAWRQLGIASTGEWQ